MAAALGFALISVPNIELITLTVFLSGYTMGIKNGIITGIISITIYSVFNPYGMAAPPLLASQIFSYGVTGAIGGFFRRIKANHFYSHLLFAGAGFLSTFLYAFLTTLSFTLFIGSSRQGFFAAILYGLGFYIAHLISNTIIFGAAAPLLVKILQNDNTFNQQSCVS